MSREGKPMVNKPLIRAGYFRGGGGVTLGRWGGAVG